MASKSLEERFWEKVRIGSAYDCWEWMGHVSRDGYGSFRINGKVDKAHRASWVISKGSIDQKLGRHGSYICHSCDNRRCVNPSHLFLGSAHDNNMDMAMKGRHGNQKISRDMIPRIFSLRSSGMMHKDIARIMGVSRSRITVILGAELRSIVSQPPQAAGSSLSKGDKLG